MIAENPGLLRLMIKMMRNMIKNMIIIQNLDQHLKMPIKILFLKKGRKIQLNTHTMRVTLIYYA